LPWSKEAIGRVAASAALGAVEIAVADGIDRQFEQCLGQAGLVEQQRGVVLRELNLSLGSGQQLSQPASIDGESAVAQRGPGPCAAYALQPQALEGLGGGKPKVILEPESDPGLQILGRPVLTLWREPRDL
jgi:hypothetical protein